MIHDGVLAGAVLGESWPVNELFAKADALEGLLDTSYLKGKLPTRLQLALGCCGVRCDFSLPASAKHKIKMSMLAEDISMQASG